MMWPAGAIPIFRHPARRAGFVFTCNVEILRSRRSLRMTEAGFCRPYIIFLEAHKKIVDRKKKALDTFKIDDKQ
jgi:hypothetical protein